MINELLFIGVIDTASKMVWIWYFFEILEATKIDHMIPAFMFIQIIYFEITLVLQEKI